MKTFKQFILSEINYIRTRPFKRPTIRHGRPLITRAPKKPQKTRPSIKPQRAPHGTKLLPSLSTRLNPGPGHRKQSLGKAIKGRVKDALHPANIAGNIFGKTAGHIVGSLTGASRERMNTIKYGYK